MRGLLFALREILTFLQTPVCETFEQWERLIDHWWWRVSYWHQVWRQHYLARVRIKTKLIFRSYQKINYQRHFWQSVRAGVAIALTMSFLTAGEYIYREIFIDLPDVKLLATAYQEATTKIYDRNYHLLFTFYRDENRSPVPLSSVSPYLVAATVAIEDQSFYQHRGFDIRGIIRAYFINQGEKVIRQGGSTITQQLVKKRLLTSEKTFTRKLKELVLSVLAEGNFTKDQILEMYLNEINYGGAIYGIEQAAISYFGKNARDLSLAESSFLAAIPAYPSYFAPFAGHLKETQDRQKEVLRRMVEDGYISAEEAQQASSQELRILPTKINIEAPHFVMYVRDLLVDRYGEEMVTTGGLEVVTTLDLAMQNKVQAVVSEEVASLARLNIHNGAALVTNPTTGEILAMIGSRDYFDPDYDGMVNVTLMPRQPGSSIKPLTYSLALENGYTPATLIDDTPITYQYPGGKPYSPKNYDGSYRGRVTMRESLASSYNIPAVKMLNTLGVSNLIDHGEKMGITTWGQRERFGLSLTLGGGEVKMIDMARLYGAFANGGYSVAPNPVLAIYNSKQELIYENDCAVKGLGCLEKQVISEMTAYQITNILSDNIARSKAFGIASVLHIPGQEVAVKTGTTNNLRDNWTIGYTNDRLVAVWVGNNDNTPMSYVASGITGASPIWHDIISLTLNPDKPNVFTTPSNLVAVPMCGRSNYLEYFQPGTQPSQACIMQAQINPPIEYTEG